MSTLKTVRSVALLLSITLLVACESSGGSEDDNNQSSGLPDITGDNTIMSGDGETDTDGTGTTGSTNNGLDITYTTLEALPDLQERLYGGSSLKSPIVGPQIGIGDYLNADLVRDVPFTIDGEITPGLVIEKLYAVRDYDRRGFSIDGQVLAGGPIFRKDLPTPRIYAVITNLSNVDMCNVNTGRSFGIDGGAVLATMVQGGVARARTPLIGEGIQYTVDGRDNSGVCINPGGSIYVYAEFETEKFSEFHEGDDYADIEDIVSVSISELFGRPRAPIALEKGLEVQSYQYAPESTLLNQPKDNYSMTVINRSDKRLDHTDGLGFILDPQTSLPVGHFTVHGFQNRDDDRGNFSPGDEVTEDVSSGGEMLLQENFMGSSDLLLFLNGFEPEFN